MSSTGRAVLWRRLTGPAGITGIALVLGWIGVFFAFRDSWLGLVFAGIWGLAAFERVQAIYLLGARIPPMGPPVKELPEGFFQRIGAFFKNPVTWKGMTYLLVKFPLGVLTFVSLVTLLSISAALLLAPFYYQWPGIDMLWWQVDTLGEALVCSAIGLMTLFVSLNLLNGLGLHASYDAVFADGGNPGVFGIGAHYTFAVPGL